MPSNDTNDFFCIAKYAANRMVLTYTVTEKLAWMKFNGQLRKAKFFTVKLEVVVRYQCFTYRKWNDDGCLTAVNKPRRKF